MEEALHVQLKHRASGNSNDQTNPDQIESFVEDDDSRYKQIGRAASSRGEGSWRILLSEFPPLDQPATSSRAAKKCFGKSRVDQYYHQQEVLLQRFTELDSITDEPTTTEASIEASRAHIAKRERIAINISNATNLVLFAAKVVASIESKSLAIIASTMDSLLDLLSGFILWFASVSMRHPNPYRYPIGKKRMQPLGIIVFSSVMATLGLLILLESIRQLISKDHALALKGPQGMWVIGIMVAVTVIKLILMLYCRMYKDEIVRAYAQDHLFDVITNSIGLVAAFLASKFYWWIDPLGAILLALFTIRTWSITVLENVKSLVGKSASPEFLQKLTYLCWNHHEDIKQIDTVKAYNFGSSYFAEIDIVLSAEMPLREAHDIGESLQNKLEKLPEIERAFVHLDYECSHKPEHACIDAS